jgi:hypothetical protein
MPPPFERPSLLRACAYAVHQPVLVRAIAILSLALEFAMAVPIAQRVITTF